MTKSGRIVSFYVLLSALANGINANGNYVIVTPKFLQDKQPYQVSISTFGLNDFSKMHLKITGVTNGDEESKEKNSEEITDNNSEENKEESKAEESGEDNTKIFIQRDLEFMGTGTHLEEIDTTALKPGSYRLTLSSDSGAIINREVDLEYQERTHTVLIQTDRPIYKPGDTVKFRILVLNQATKPVSKLSSIRVTLSDPGTAMISQWKQALLRNGVFQSQLDLANEPNLGNWTITVEVEEKEHEFSFLVEEYKLPQHKITISSSKVLSLDDEQFSINIDARYAFGKPVKGAITVVAKGAKQLQKSSKIDGDLKISFGMQDLIASPRHADNMQVDVEVLLRELHSKKVFRETQSFTVFKNSHQIRLIKSSKYIVPGHSYTCSIQLSDPLGRKLPPKVRRISINVTYAGEEDFSETVQQHLSLDAEGTAPLKLDIPQQAFSADIEVTYENSNELFTLETNRQSRKDHFQAAILTQTITINRQVSVQVQSSFPMNSLVYHVISRKRIVMVEKVQVNGEKSKIFNFKVTDEMVPRAKVFVTSFYNGQILSDTVAVNLAELPNTISLSISDQQATPGERIKLTIDSKPKSIVGLLAIDKRALQLSRDNQLTKQKVLEASGQYDVDEEEFDINDDIVVISNAVNPNDISARFGSSVSDDEDAYIPPRKIFPESWLWHDLNEVGADGKLTIWDRVPDSLTSWEISAFSLSAEHGLGILDEPISLTVFNPFILALNLPYSIKFSEIAIVEASVFNYQDEMAYVGVTLKNSRQEFEFVDNAGRKDASYQTKNVVLTPHSAKMVQFKIKPKKLGNIVLKVIAESTEGSDSVEQLLSVTPESLYYYKPERRSINVRNSRQDFNITFDIPRYIDNQSEIINFTLNADLVGGMLDNLHDEIRLPSGNGEQNILKMVPSAVLMDYINATDSFEQTIQRKAIKSLRTGYQNELKFKRDDGSFSIAGKDDPNGSTFLTALVAKTLQQASHYMSIDKKVIDKAYDWLKTHQATDGKFVQTGQVSKLEQIHSDDVTLTAYVLIAFLEDETIAEKYKSVIDKGISYLANKYFNEKSEYALGLITYAFDLARYDAATTDSVFGKFIENSQNNAEKRWWNTKTTSVETTAYGLLTYIKRNQVFESQGIMNWLSSRPRNFGPEDIKTTFIALQAMVEYGKTMASARNNYSVTLNYENKNTVFTLDPQSSQTVYNISLPKSVRNIAITAEGIGTGIFTVSYSYWSNILRRLPRFDLSVETLNTSSDSYLDLKVCGKFKPEEAYAETGLVLMEIAFPSGYIALDDTVDELSESDIVKKVETKHGDASLLLYFEKFPVYTQCLDVSGFRQSKVLQQVPGTVRIYDFFDDSRVAIAYIHGMQVQPCDICGDNCPEECKG